VPELRPGCPVPRALILLVFLTALAGASCDELYPEVIVINEIDESVLVREISYSGCLWDGVLAFGEASSPGRCLPGDGRVHFARLDSMSYCREQVDDGTIPELCYCDPADAPEEDPLDSGLINETPQWFNYQTLTSYQAEAGDLLIVRLTLEDMEQDFSVPGPYGH
jgi:hypothetical protein